jgi:hypothetical protein
MATELDEFLWFIDRMGNPDINLNNSGENETYIYEINNNIITGTINNNIIYDDTNDYDYTIPFERPFVSIIVDEFMEITQEQLECCICMTEREKQNICKLNCMHTYCDGCLEQSLSRCQYNCALCREKITKIIVQTEEIREKLI